MFTTAALLEVVKICKGPMTDWWEDRKLRYIYILEYSLAIRKEEILVSASTWVELKAIMLKEINLKWQKEDRKFPK